MATLLGGSEATPPLERARAALEGVQDDPRRSLRTARDLLDGGAEDPRVRIHALWAEGQAHRELNAIGAACASLAAASRLAGEEGDEETRARIRMSLSLALFTSGEKDEAFVELDAALDRLAGTEHARALMQRGLLQFQLGEIGHAVGSFDAALPVLEAGGDRLAEARLRVNRALALTFLGRLRAAELDLLAAQRLAEALGQKLIAAGAQHNLGVVASRRGDVPSALAWYDRARASYRALADPRRLLAVLDADRCDVLLAAGLNAEAVEAATSAAQAHASDGNETDLAEAELLLARAHLARGAFDEARTVAERSRQRFARSSRRAWAALAGYVAVQARVVARGDHDLGAALFDQTVGLADELSQLGWRTEALHVRSFAARTALELGDRGRARRELEVSAAARHRGPAAQRAQAWHATALLRHLEGNDQGARRALEAGLRLIDEARSALGSSELRAAVAQHGVDLTDLGVDLARRRQRPRELLAWLERSRALALLAPPVRPPDDQGFASELASLRQARGDAREAIAEGRPADEAQHRVLRLERSVRNWARLARGSGLLPTPSTVRGDLALLGDRVLVEYLVAAGRVLVLVVRGGRVRQQDLGPVGDLEADLDSLSFVLHRISRTRGSEASRALAARTLEEAGSRLGARLIDPILGHLGHGPLVIVADGAMERAPWRAMPALRSRPFTLSPSLRAHAAAASRTGAPDPSPAVVLVAGAGLPGAAAEVTRLRALHPGAVVLAGADATVEAVCDALGRCQLAHLACHGRLRVDNPLFSSLTMADGELTVYDLERCARVPTTMILSACDSGLGNAPTPREVVGFSTALLSLGCATVVAPVSPVSDVATTGVMVALHEGLQRGERPSVALAGAAPLHDRREAWTSWMAFAAFGAG